MLAARMPTHHTPVDLPHGPPRLRRRALLLGAAGATLAGAARADDPKPQAWAATRPVPPLSLPLLGSAQRWTLDQARGRVLLLNFWASWCEPCRSEMPSLELLAHRHEAEGLLVMTVNYRESPVAIERFLAQMPVDLPMLRDADGATSRAWGARVFPTTVLVDRQGRPQFTVVGEVDWLAESTRRWLLPHLRR